MVRFFFFLNTKSFPITIFLTKNELIYFSDDWILIEKAMRTTIDYNATIRFIKVYLAEENGKNAKEKQKKTSIQNRQEPW